MTTPAPPEPKPGELAQEILEDLREFLVKSQDAWDTIANHCQPAYKASCEANGTAAYAARQRLTKAIAELTRLQARVAELERLVAANATKNIGLIGDKQLLQARVAELERLIAAKDDALRAFACRDNWDGGEWSADPDPLGDQNPAEFAQAALNMKAEP